MEDETIQKPWIDTLSCGIKVVKLVSYLRLEFNIDFIRQGVSFCMLKDTFLSVKSQRLQQEILVSAWKVTVELLSSWKIR